MFKVDEYLGLDTLAERNEIHEKDSNKTHVLLKVNLDLFIYLNLSNIILDGIDGYGNNCCCISRSINLY